MRSFFSAYRITDRNLCKFFEMDFFCRARRDFSLSNLRYTALMYTDMGTIVVTNMLMSFYYYIQMTYAPTVRLWWTRLKSLVMFIVIHALLKKSAHNPAQVSCRLSVLQLVWRAAQCLQSGYISYGLSRPPISRNKQLLKSHEIPTTKACHYHKKIISNCFWINSV